MVYGGRISPNCEMCRKRRRKCNLSRPICAQCTRAGTTCIYRDTLSLIFRDESSKILARQQQPTRSKKQSRTAEDQKFQDSKAMYATESSSPKEPAINLNTNRLSSYLQDAGIAFFLTTFIQGSHFSWLPSLYHETASCMPLTLVSSVRAVSLAGLSLELSRPDILYMARQQYAIAIRSVNKTLLSSDTAVLDSTLASVTILSLFETVSNTSFYKISSYGPANADSKVNWANHVKGSLALLHLRGPDQFKTQVGMALYRHIATNIRFSSVQRKERVPQALRDLAVAAKFTACPTIDGTERPEGESVIGLVEGFDHVVDELAEFRATVGKGDLTDHVEIMKAANRLDGQMMVIQERIPEPWQFDVIKTPISRRGVWQQRYHVYPDHCVAQFWNTIRMGRLILQHVIIEKARKLSMDTAYKADIDVLRMVGEHATEIGRNVARDICSSVPQFTKALDHPSSAPSTVASGFFLIWPLYVAGSSPLVSTELKLFAVERLNWIGKELKIPQAIEAAIAMVEGDLEEEDWMHMFHLL